MNTHTPSLGIVARIRLAGYLVQEYGLRPLLSPNNAAIVSVLIVVVLFGIALRTLQRNTEAELGRDRVQILMQCNSYVDDGNRIQRLHAIEVRTYRAGLLHGNALRTFLERDAELSADETRLKRRARACAAYARTI